MNDANRNSILPSIILTPKDDTQATEFKENHIVHQLELDQVKSIIAELKEKGKTYNPKEKFQRVYNTITLSGTRGTGKTSFLYTLKNDLKNDNNIGKDVEYLDIIDPTLIEEKGHIFLNIVARINTLVDDIDTQKRKDEERYNKWNETLKKLAAGLPMLDGICGGLDPSDWNDTTFVMMDGLKRVNGANNLELYFHKYIEQSLELLGKKYFIIAFDDVDTDFSKGWLVLEVLRKYLTSPQIITFLSGDLDLYSFVVRKHQWKNFGKSLLKNEYDKENDESFTYAKEYPRLVEKLTSQYMIKLLKPEYRIILSTLGAKLSSKQIEIYVDEKEDEKENIKLEKFYSSYLEQIWNVRGLKMQEVSIKFFTNLPLRSQLSLLNTLQKIKTTEINGHLSTRIHDVSKELSDIFYSELQTAKVNVWEMINGYSLTCIYLLKFLVDNKILDEASQFFPKLNDPSLDASSVVLGSVLSEKIVANPYEIFDYIIRISNIVAKVSWGYKGDKKTPNIEDYLSHSYSLFDYGLQKIASLQSSYILSFPNTAQSEGLIPIQNEQRRAKSKRKEDNLRIDEIFDGKDSLTRSLGYLPAFTVKDNKGVISTYYSINNILASIGDIIYQEPREMLNEFMRMTQLREYPLYLNQYEQNIDEKEEEDNENEEEINFPDSNENQPILAFINEIREWKESWFIKRIILPPYLLGRVMVRTKTSFSKINTKSNINVGNNLHRLLIIFLNAVLVEEVMENNGNSKLRLTNPSDSDSFFIHNYNKNSDNHPFFDFIFACPLIRAYLNPNIFDELNARRRLNDIYGGYVYKELVELNIKGIKIENNSEKEHLQDIGIRRALQSKEFDPREIISFLKGKRIRKEQITINEVIYAMREIAPNRKVNANGAKFLLEQIKNSDKW